MFNSLFAFSVVALLLSSQAADAYINLNSSLSLAGSAVDQVKPFGIIGYTDCGVARTVDVRLTGCTTSPCQLDVGSQVVFEVDWIPRDQHWIMDLRAVLLGLQDYTLVTLFNGGLPDSTVWPDQMYTYSHRFTVPSAFRGEGEFRVILHQNFIQEVCLVIPINI